MRFHRLTFGTAVAAMFASAVAHASVNSWQLLGPQYSTTSGGSPVTGIVHDIDAHNHRVLGFYGGLWGFNIVPFSMSNTLPAKLDLYSTVASPPSDPNTIFVGMDYGELFKSSDGGSTWTTVFTSSEINRIRYSPDGSVLHLACDQGYFRSTDGGAHWTQGTGAPPAMTELCTVIGMPNTLFGTCGRFGQLSLYRSDNAGVSWQPVSTLASASASNASVSAIATGGSVLVVVSFSGSVWRSADNGGTWQNVSTFPHTSVVPVSICPSNSNIVLAGQDELRRSTDGGLTWSTLSVPTPHAGCTIFAWEDNGTAVWAGTVGGWIHSADQGQTWDASSNLMPIATLDELDCERTEAGMMVGGTHGSSILVTQNEGLVWNDVAAGGDAEDTAGPVTLDQFMPQRMWAAAPFAPLYRSSDYGVTWKPTGSGLPLGGGAIQLANDDAPGPHLFWSQGFHVFESSDTGLTFVETTPGAFANRIISLTSSQRVSGGAVLYVTTLNTTGSRLFVRDGGIWSDRTGTLPGGLLTKVVPHPWAADANEAWTFMSGPNRIFHTTDRGVTWTEITGDFPSLLAINDLVPNPHTPGELYAATIQGCWRTLNGGVNWEPWLNGMPTYGNVTQLAYIDRIGSGGPFTVVAAVRGRAVWQRDAAGSDPQPSITIGNASCVEGSSGTTTMTFQLTLSGALSGNMVAKMDYSTVDGSAVAGSDYQSTSGTLTFPYGQNTTTLTVPVNGDTQIEPDETFSLVLSNPIRCTIANGTGTGTIEDDDAAALVHQGMPVTDGAVIALAASGDTLFVGGEFGSIGPSTGSGMPVDSVTAQPVWLPKVAGYVNAVASDGSGGWYLGGGFSHVAGQPRQNLAHVLADHTLDPWNPAPDGTVFALAERDTTLYVGGGFTHIGGAPRNDIAAFVTTTGTLKPWDPNADGTVVSLAMKDTTLYAGGDFLHVGGQARARIAALTGAGAATSWNPGANNEVESIVTLGALVYAAGAFDSLGGQIRHHIGALDAGTGNPTGWNPNADGYVSALAVVGSTVYAGGPYATIGGQSRSGLAALDANTGLATGWAPNPDAPVLAFALDGSTLYMGGTFLTIAGQPRAHAAAFDLAGNLTSWAPQPDGAVLALSTRQGQVFLGGDYGSFAPQKRSNLAAVSISTGAVLSWNPGADNSVTALALSGSTLYAAGTFGVIGGQSRSRIAALNTATGVPTAWNPGANARVYALLPIGTSAVIAAGQFTSIGGQARNRIAALSASSGTATSWNPNANNIVASVATDGVVIYAGGAFTSIGGQARNGLAALSASTGAATTWNPAPNGLTSTLLWSNSVLWVGGSFTNIAGVGRGHAAVLTASSIQSWNPNANNAVNVIAPMAGGDVYLAGPFTAIGTATRHNLAAARVSNGTATAFAPEPNSGVNAIVTAGSSVWVGGAFTTIGGLPQRHLAMLIAPNLVAVPGATAVPVRDLALEITPNPAHGDVRFAYALPSSARVKIGVYDVLGRRVSPAIDRLEEPGAHSFVWQGADGRGHAEPGIYFVRIEAAGRQLTRRFAVVR